MILSYKERLINLSKPVYCYRALNRKIVWYSIKQGNLVVAHGYDFILKDVNFIVREGGNRRAKNSGERNVHAFAKGYIKPAVNLPLDFQHYRISYNPFHNNSFIQNGTPITNAHSIYFSPEGVFNISTYLYKNSHENIHF